MGWYFTVQGVRGWPSNVRINLPVWAQVILTEWSPCVDANVLPSGENEMDMVDTDGLGLGLFGIRLLLCGNGRWGCGGALSFSASILLCTGFRSLLGKSFASTRTPGRFRPSCRKCCLNNSCVSSCSRVMLPSTGSLGELGNRWLLAFPPRCLRYAALKRVADEYSTWDINSEWSEIGGGGFGGLGFSVKTLSVLLLSTGVLGASLLALKRCYEQVQVC